MLTQLVEQFTKKHEAELIDPETGENTKVQHQPYWDQLQEMIYSGGGKPAAGNANPSRVLVNADALELSAKISATVNQKWPGAGRPHLLRKPTPDKIRLWAAYIEGKPDAEQELARHLQHWINQIDRLEEPVDTIFPPCPNCERDHIIIDTSNGRRQHQALESNGKAVWCNACDNRWEGIPGMKLLARILWQGNPEAKTA